MLVGKPQALPGDVGFQTLKAKPKPHEEICSTLKRRACQANPQPLEELFFLGRNTPSDRSSTSGTVVGDRSGDDSCLVQETPPRFPSSAKKQALFRRGGALTN